MEFFFEEKSDYSTTFIRLALGIIMTLAGFGKVMKGNEGITSMATSMGFPVILMWAAALIELIGGILILVGFYTRTSAFLIACVMLVATIVVINGGAPFMGGSSIWAWPLVNFLMAVSLLFSGTKVISVDK